MIKVPSSLLEEIQKTIKDKCKDGEKGWTHAEYEEDTLVGDFLGNLRTTKTIKQVHGKIYEWEIVYKKFQGRGKDALESKTGADGIITFEINDQTQNIRTVKSLIFQAKKKGNYNDLKEQKSKMDQVAKEGNFVLRLSSDGYFAEQNGSSKKGIGDFLSDDFLSCKTGIEGMSFDSIRKELKFATLSFIHFDIDKRLTIKIDKL